MTTTSKGTSASGGQLSLDEYDRIVSSIHEGAMDTEGLYEALETLRTSFDANYVTLILRISDVDDFALMLVAGNQAVRGRVAYFKHLQQDDPFVGQIPDTVFSIDSILSAEAWQSSRYYREYARPSDVYHVMGADITAMEAGMVRFRVTRGHDQPAFSESDRGLCLRLLPHLRRSLRMHNLFDRSESISHLHAEAIKRLSIATLMLDQSGSVLQLNDVAKELLARADGLKLVGSRLEASYPSDHRELYKLIRSAADTKGMRPAAEGRATLAIARPSGEVSLGLVVEPIPGAEWVEGQGHPVVMVYIRDAVARSQVDTKIAKELFNFTPAESALALHLANGLSLEEAAESLGIMRNTARAHLRSMFSKTGASRQAELVRVLLNSVAAMGHSDVALSSRCICEVVEPELRLL